MLCSVLPVFDSGVNTVNYAFSATTISTCIGACDVHCSWNLLSVIFVATYICTVRYSYIIIDFEDVTLFSLLHSYYSKEMYILLTLTGEYIILSFDGKVFVKYRVALN